MQKILALSLAVIAGSAVYAASAYKRSVDYAQDKQCGIDGAAFIKSEYRADDPILWNTKVHFNKRLNTCLVTFVGILTGPSRKDETSVRKHINIYDLNARDFTVFCQFYSGQLGGEGSCAPNSNAAKETLDYVDKLMTE